jgi:hypothetical protein
VNLRDPAIANASSPDRHTISRVVTVPPISGWIALPARLTHLVAGLIGMSTLESSNLAARPEVASHELDSDDRSWLYERLEEYRELLTYLHHH